MVKKITRKQLLKEPDEFMTFSGKLIKLLTSYKKQITIGSCTVFAALIIAGAYQGYLHRAENKASALLAESLGQYLEVLKDKDFIAGYQAVEKSFAAILADYPSRNAGKVAMIEFGNICFRAEEFDRAISLYKKALEHFDTPYYRNLILSSLGYSYEAVKDYKNAVNYFEMLADSSDKALKDSALFSLALAHEKLGNKEKSREIFTSMIKEFPASIFSEVAREKTSG